MNKHRTAAPQNAAVFIKQASVPASRKGKKMTEIEEKLLLKANEMHARIFPCPPRNDFKHCFTRENNKLFFWYNTEDKSTHVLTADLRT